MELSPIFIVGCPRSGTSLLRDLLRAHPRLSFPDESHIIPAFYRSYGHPRDEDEAQRLGEKLCQTRWIGQWSVDVAPDAFGRCRTYGEIVDTIYRAVAERDGKVRWGDKTPQYVAEIPTLVEIFPHCQVIHIVRDGRDVAQSLVRQGFGPTTLFTAALQWRDFVRAGRRAGAALPAGTYAEVRYEEFVADPEAAMRRLCAFLGEEYTPDVLRRGKRPRKDGVKPWVAPRKKEKSLWNEPAPVASNAGKWRLEMAPEDRAIVEAAAGDLLSELGYEVEGWDRKPGRWERLVWSGRDAVGWVVYRLRQPTRGEHLKSGLALSLARLRGLSRTRHR